MKQPNNATEELHEIFDSQAEQEKSWSRKVESPHVSSGVLSDKIFVTEGKTLLIADKAPKSLWVKAEDVREAVKELSDFVLSQECMLNVDKTDCVVCEINRKIKEIFGEELT